MNILIIGSGGRECAFAWKIKQSPLCQNLYVAPGNAGTLKYAQNIPIKTTDFPAIENFIRQNAIEMLVVGPEAPLVEGIRDYFEAQSEFANLIIVGPNKRGAALEGSKDISKQFMLKYGVPTAKAATFVKSEAQKAFEFAENAQLPLVIKADGLAAGKGVVIAYERQTAQQAISQMLEADVFGEAGNKILIEEFLDGIEVSFFVLCDGKNFLVLPEAKDYKRIGEADKGLNTGGMGAVSPVPFVDKVLFDKILEKAIKPTVNGLAAEGIDYKGIVFFGFMIVKGEPYLLEYNVRMGDPETEAVLPRIKSDLVPIFKAMHEQKLDEIVLEKHDEFATTIMLVSGGYPEKHENGKEMTGFENLPQDVFAFFAGAKAQEGKIYTDGGRVLALTGMGKTMQEALANANVAAKMVQYEKKYFRSDIGFDL